LLVDVDVDLLRFVVEPDANERGDAKEEKKD